MTAEKLLLRIPEVADSLGLSRARVYELVASGELPSIRDGRAVRVPRHALVEWIATRAASAKDGREPGRGGQL